MRKGIVGLMVILAVALALNIELLNYGWSQARGQLHILRNVTEVSDVLADPTYPDSLKQQIRLIQEIKQFGVDSLGLKPSSNYTTFYDQGGRKLMWIVTGAERYAVEPYTWDFPIVGKFPYKGFFDSTQAYKEQSKLLAKDYDTYMGEAAAWSMLGIVRDPILSSMLERSEGSLANLILHELTHENLFVTGDMELNENLASFVGDWGAEQFLIAKYGYDSKELKRYRYGKLYSSAWSKHMLRGAERLDSLYSTFQAVPETVKERLKEQLLMQIAADTDTLLQGRVGRDNLLVQKKLELNNAYFIGYKTYRSKQNQFRDEFENSFNSNFKEYMHYLMQKYPPRKRFLGLF